jgi:hypothetical protein
MFLAMAALITLPTTHFHHDGPVDVTAPLERDSPMSSGLPGPFISSIVYPETGPQEVRMAKVCTHLTMSLDGYIADPKDGVGELFGWYSAGDVTVPSADERWPFHLDANSAEMLREMLARAGALVCGRRLFDLTNGWASRTSPT